MGWMAKLTLVRPDEPEPVAIRLQEGALLFGRTLPSEYCVPIVQMSREHMWLRLHPDGGLTIEDAQSASGIYVDGKQIAGRIVTIKTGNVITFGGCTLRLDSVVRDDLL